MEEQRVQRRLHGCMDAVFLSCLARAYAELDQVDDAWRCIGEAMTAAANTMPLQGIARLQDHAAIIPSTRTGEWLLAWLTTRAQRDDVLGDLQEEYLTDRLPTLGARSAKVWYWAQIVKSLWPFLRAGVRRAITVVVVIRLIRRLGL